MRKMLGDVKYQDSPEVFGALNCKLLHAALKREKLIQDHPNAKQQLIYLDPIEIDSDYSDHFLQPTEYSRKLPEVQLEARINNILKGKYGFIEGLRLFANFTKRPCNPYAHPPADYTDEELLKDALPNQDLLQMNLINDHYLDGIEIRIMNDEEHDPEVLPQFGLTDRSDPKASTIQRTVTKMDETWGKASAWVKDQQNKQA